MKGNNSKVHQQRAEEQQKVKEILGKMITTHNNKEWRNNNKRWQQAITMPSNEKLGSGSNAWQ